MARAKLPKELQPKQSELNRAIFTREADKAAILYQELIDAMPDFVMRGPVQFDLAKLMENNGKDELSLKAYEAIIQHQHDSPTRPQALKGAGKQAIKVNDYDLALKYLEDFLRTDPLRPEREEVEKILNGLPAEYQKKREMGDPFNGNEDSVAIDDVPSSWSMPQSSEPVSYEWSVKKSPSSAGKMRPPKSSEDSVSLGAMTSDQPSSRAPESAQNPDASGISLGNAYTPPSNPPHPASPNPPSSDYHQLSPPPQHKPQPSSQPSLHAPPPPMNPVSQHGQDHPSHPSGHHPGAPHYPGAQQGGYPPIHGGPGQQSAPYYPPQHGAPPPQQQYGQPPSSHPAYPPAGSHPPQHGHYGYPQQHQHPQQPPQPYHHPQHGYGGQAAPPSYPDISQPHPHGPQPQQPQSPVQPPPAAQQPSPPAAPPPPPAASAPAQPSKPSPPARAVEPVKPATPEKKRKSVKRTFGRKKEAEEAPAEQPAAAKPKLDIDKPRSGESPARETAEDRYHRLRDQEFALLLPVGKRIHLESVAHMVSEYESISESAAKKIVMRRKGILYDGLTLDNLSRLSPLAEKCQQSLSFVAVPRHVKPYEVYEILGAEMREQGLKLTTDQATLRLRWEDLKLINCGQIVQDSVVTLIGSEPVKEYLFSTSTFNYHTFSSSGQTDFRSAIPEFLEIIRDHAPNAFRSHTVENLLRRKVVSPQPFSSPKEYRYYTLWILYSHFGEPVDAQELVQMSQASSNW